ncbi:branched-chain amino acid ABC transporter substrate-binding protein [Planosporangium flavigriseum]|uniref:Putative ABC transporter/extracellular ligand-binding receptor n=1 Tax=Planosporangium flavigriseum TaxID=373681 RepID=A0A8J3PKH4_9ACTN|nr:putative ABC transporter/extracellular ligand-binding receptor [Planosporangium flavigriseum]
MRVAGGAALAAAMVASAAACASSNGGETAAANKCGYKIAFFGALTGGNAILGINIRDGAKLALKQYNDKHKDCTVDLVEKDSEGSAEKAPPLATAVAGDSKILGVVGPAFSGESKVANPILSSAGVVILTASATNPALATSGWKTFHRGLGNDASQGPAAARYIKNTLKAQKVFVIDDASEYGKGLADQVKQTLGTAVIGSDVIQEKQTDFSALVAKIQAANPDAIFHGGYVREGAPFLKQLRGAGVKATYVAGDGAKTDDLISGAGKDSAEGSILTCPCVPGDKVEGSFPADYKALSGRDPGTYSAEAYDAANILLKGIEAGNTTRAKLNDFVSKYEGQGITTKFKFQDNGELDPNSVAVWAYIVKNGQIVPDKEIPKA